MQHKCLQSALLLMTTYLYLLNLLSLSLSSTSLLQHQCLTLMILYCTLTLARNQREVCILVHPRPGITNLKRRVSRLRTAGEELYRPTLFSASCCAPPPSLSSSSLFLSSVTLSVFLPCFIYRTLSECLGPRPQKTAVGLLLSIHSGYFNSICHHWESGMCMCRACYAKILLLHVLCI